jgi:ribosome-binding protein aMBF1 (putative translation factor)
MTDRMNKDELIACREAIGWSREQLAEKLKCAGNTVRKMEEGTREIPEIVGQWLRGLAAAHSVKAPHADAWKIRLPREAE